jgi:glycosyltransferase involved in cell wall biosynthesis
MLVGVMGLGRFILFALFHALTSPRIWERVFVHRLSNRKVAMATRDLRNYHCDDLVSIVLPVNNGRSKGVERLVASIKAQTHKNVELIAVDSGSTDDTVVWLRSEGFNVIEIPPDSFTHSYSRNLGAAQAKGAYLLFVVDDVVFDDRDWLRSAIFLLKTFGVDALSSRQAIDNKADVYARVLDFFLSQAQSARRGINISRNNKVATALRWHLPLRAQFRSVTIDDTNHLVRRKQFEAIKFASPTVEDIDFALRLTRAGRKILYTNLLSVTHYHKYDVESLIRYSKRVFVDTTVIAGWQPYLIKMASREAFLVSAYYALGLVLNALDLLDQPSEWPIPMIGGQGEIKVGCIPKEERRIKRSAINELLAYLYLKYPKNMELSRSQSFEVARSIFAAVIGGEPPSELFYDENLDRYFLARFRQDIILARETLLAGTRESILLDELRVVCLFLWCNRVMSHAPRADIFRSKSISYAMDKWNIGSWA